MAIWEQAPFLKLTLFYQRNYASGNLNYLLSQTTVSFLENREQRTENSRLFVIVCPELGTQRGTQAICSIRKPKHRFPIIVGKRHAVSLIK